MAVNAKQYREHLYRLRSHPSAIGDDFVDQRNSFTSLYVSLIPFLAMEYICEASFDHMPSGLVFPLSFLLFWAFYYTYYKPGFLEDRLTSPQKWDLIGIPTVLIGVVVWFVKVTVVELTGLFLRLVFGVKKPEGRPRPQARPNAHQQQHAHAHAHAHAHGNSYSHHQERRHERPHQQQQHYQRPNPHANTEGTRFYQAPPKAPPQSSLPREVLQALHTLGLAEGADWNQIHKRYRELAKQYHPDLNKEITEVGRRFMTYDAAYRKLASVKVRYFPEKRVNG